MNIEPHSVPSPRGKATKKQSRSVSLYSLMWGASVLLVMTSLIGVATLLPLSNFITAQSGELKDVEDTVRVATTLKNRLLEYHKAAIAFAASTEVSSREEMAEKRRDAQELIGQLRALENDPAQIRLVGQVESAIQHYFDVPNRRDQLRLSLQKRILSEVDALELALSLTDALVQVEIVDADANHQKFLRTNSLFRRAAVVIAFQILLASFSMVIGIRRLLFLPLSRLQTAIMDYRHGNRNARANSERVFEVNDIGRAFNSMADQLSRIEERRLEFLAGVAHDLRNPLTALKMAGPLIERGLEVPREKLLATLKLINHQVVRLDRLVSDFLDGSRIEGGKFLLNVKEANFISVIHDTLALWQPVVPRKFDVLLPEKAVMVSCDAGRVEQVLNNLVSNAIKYSPNDRAIEIALKQDDQETTISVRDHGIGIETADLEDIFLPFRRTQEARELVAGVGLGLSVSKKIVEAHGGKLLVESMIGEGSIFSIVLPNKQRARHAA